MKLRFLTPILALLVLTIAACAPPPELRNDAFLRDTSLIDAQPCGIPCWRGIVPGETAWNEALTIIEDDPSLTDIRVEASNESREIAATFQQSGGIPCCLIYSENGATVDQMLLQVAPDMTVGQVIEANGEPEFVAVAEITNDQASAALYYPDQQVIVYAFVAGAGGQLTANSEIFAIVYLRPSDVERSLQNMTLAAWQGYASFSDYASAVPVITPVPTPD